MKNIKSPVLFSGIIIFLAFLLHFSYFAVLNRNLLAYQEQIQLFRFNPDYFPGFLSKPGGLSEYAGAFLMQFYVNPTIGALIVTIAAFGIFAICRGLLKKLDIKGVLWPLILVFLLLILQSDYVYYVSYTLGFLSVLVFFSFYTTLKNNYIRFAAAITGTVLLYLLAAEFSFIAFGLIISYELLYVTDRPGIGFCALYTVVALLVVYVLIRFVYLLPLDYLWIKPLIIYGNIPAKLSLILLFACLPLLLVFTGIRTRMAKKPYRNPGMNLKSFIAGLLLIFMGTFFIVRYVYDNRTELLLGMDRNVQKGNWNRVLKISAGLSEVNQIAVYLTNIALYNSGRLSDEMFHYNQIGPAGLFLGWGDEASSFFGNEVFYQLNYFNEAYRWAFETMVSKGTSPRLVKKVVLISLINDNFEVAEKYLFLLKQSLFYRKWADYYLECLADPEKLHADREINEKKQYLIHNDFFADVNDYESVLLKLLENHPGNRMAFEYLMISFLLKKDIVSFAENIHRLHEFGYSEIPVHFEEALLLIMSAGTAEFVPEGYSIRESGVKMFEDYLGVLSFRSGDPVKLQQILHDRFGKSYFYYYQFK